MRANDDLPPAPCECGRDLTDHDRDEQDGKCAKCREFQRECDLEVSWFTWLGGLKYCSDQSRMEKLSDALTGWKIVDADMQHGRDSIGKVYINSANNLRFLAPGHRGHLIFSDQNGLPVVIIHAGKDYKFPDWTATFTSCTPLETILAACNAVIHHN